MLDIDKAVSRSSHSLRYRVALCLLIMVCVGMVGCADQPGDDNDNAEATAVVHRYPLRGRIVSLPDAADPASELRIHHEAIDDFKMGDGEPAPMNAMPMSFSPGPGETLKGLEVGDPIEFVFEMHWEPAREMRAVTFKKLPADTEFVFETHGHDSSGEDHSGH